MKTQLSNYAISVLRLLSQCEVRRVYLTDWEKQFIDGLRAEDAERLTKGKFNKLEEIERESGNAMDGRRNKRGKI